MDFGAQAWSACRLHDHVVEGNFLLTLFPQASACISGANLMVVRCSSMQVLKRGGLQIAVGAIRLARLRHTRYLPPLRMPWALPQRHSHDTRRGSSSKQAASQWPKCRKAAMFSCRWLSSRLFAVWRRHFYAERAVSALSSLGCFIIFDGHWETARSKDTRILWHLQIINFSA